MTFKTFSSFITSHSDAEAVCDGLSRKEMQLVGLPPGYGMGHVKASIAERLQAAPVHVRDRSIFIIEVHCSRPGISLSEWLAFASGLTTGEALHAGACFSFVDDIRRPTTLRILVCRLSEEGERTPFSSIDRMESMGFGLRSR